MTNYGLLDILALPKLDGDGSNVRVMGQLETVKPDADGWRRASVRMIAGQAHVTPKTVQRVRDRLVKAGYIEFQPGISRTNLTGWRFTVPIGADRATPGGPQSDGRPYPPRGTTVGASTVLPQEDHGQSEPPATVVTNGGTVTQPTVDILGSDRATPGGAHALSTLDQSGVDVGEPADRAGARADEPEPDYRRGPGSRPRPRPHGGTWHPPLGPPPPNHVAADGAALARKLLADRPGADGQAADDRPAAPRTEDERRALALRQAAAGRVARGEPARTERTDEEAPLWHEGDDDEPPF